MATLSEIEKTVAEADSDPLHGMSKTQKLASFLVIVGQDLAEQILREFDEREVEDIATEMAKITFVPLIMQRALLREFSPVAIDAATSAHGGPDYARDILERSLGRYKANEVMSRVAPSRPKSVDTSILREIQPRQLVNLLRRDQPQTWALVLSYLEPIACAQVLGMLTPEQRTDIVERIATMEPVSSYVVQQVLSLIKNRLNLRTPTDVASSGGTKILAQILNNLDDNQAQQVLNSLDERNPELSRAIKKLLFVFEDLGDLDKPTITRILREVDSHDLAVSLKTASDRLKTLVFSAMSKRAVEAINEEIQFMPPVRLSDIEAAQEKILEACRTLEANGEVVLNKKGSDAKI